MSTLKRKRSGGENEENLFSDLNLKILVSLPSDILPHSYHATNREAAKQLIGLLPLILC